MRLRQLEIALQGLDGFPAPRPALEQYATPAPLAARLLFFAAGHGEIEGRTVLDLGSGTGVLACGAALLDAASVTGVEADAGAIAVAEANADRLGVAIAWVEGDVGNLPEPVRGRVFDTVVMNPPFGAQVRHADRPFVDAALAHGRTVYSLFNAGTLPFLERYIAGRGEVLETVSARLSLPRSMGHHRKETVEIPVECVRIRSLVA
ncbi:MAG TPA: methyltransferase [Methanoregulaceae archaeon]|nr:methyltransferase [Methanoregulaceae archaeon]